MQLFILTLGFVIFMTTGCGSANVASNAPPIDVTGTWVGSWTRGNMSGAYTLRLQQTGTKVVGEAVVPGYPSFAGDLEGTVDGNELSIKMASGSGGRYTVTGNEMRGYSTGTGSRIVLQRQ